MFQSVPDLGIYTWEGFQIGRKLYLVKTCALNLDQNNFLKFGFFSKWCYFRSSSLCVHGSFTFNKEQIICHRADRHPWGEPCVWQLTVLRPLFPEWASKTIVLSVLIHGRKNFLKKYRKNVIIFHIKIILYLCLDSFRSLSRLTVITGNFLGKKSSCFSPNFG